MVLDGPVQGAMVLRNRSSVVGRLRGLECSRPRSVFALVVLIAVLSISAPGQTQPSVQAPKVVHLVAERFSFTPSEIRIPLGTPLELRLRSDDTNHGFRVRGTKINMILPKRGRGEVTVTFAPDKPGRYTFECTRLCGAGHNFMRGTIVVTEGP